MSEERRDPVTSRLGMWIFLFSELLLFGALFLQFSAALERYPHEFHLAANEMSTFFGGMNTAILITSSFAMALAVSSLKRNAPARSVWLLLTTIFLAFAFLGNKAMEWGEKFHHGIYPNAPELMTRPKGEILFFNLYYIMTGLHGLHVLIGAVVFCVVIVLIRKNRISGGKPIVLENCGLYWHLVDIIWIFLFPLFYLIT